MLNVLLVGVGGSIGAVARYLLGGLVYRYYRGMFPYGTLAINVLGCLGIGFLMYLVEDKGAVGPGARGFIGGGILGGFTTFSTFGHETMALVRDGSWMAAFGYVAGNVILGLAAVWAGRTLARLVAG